MCFLLECNVDFADLLRARCTEMLSLFYITSTTLVIWWCHFLTWDSMNPSVTSPFCNFSNLFHVYLISAHILATQFHLIPWVRSGPHVLYNLCWESLWPDPLMAEINRAPLISVKLCQVISAVDLDHCAWTGNGRTVQPDIYLCIRSFYYAVPTLVVFEPVIQA